MRGQRVAKGRQLTSREVERLFAVCRNDQSAFLAVRDEATLAVLLYAGLRRTELIRLKLEDFDPRSGVLQVQFGKGNKQRALSLPNPAKQKLKAWLKQRGSMPGPLFLRLDEPQSGRSRDKNAAPNQNCKQKIATPLQALNAHQVRAANVSFEDRQDLLGHKSSRITDHYSSAELADLIEAAEKACVNGSRKTHATKN